MRVICVDDEEFSLKNIMSVCSEIKNFSNVKGFSTSKKALEYVQKGEKVDVAILDIDMPEMNGIVLAKEIKSFCASTLFLYTSTL